MSYSRTPLQVLTLRSWSLHAAYFALKWMPVFDLMIYAIRKVGVD